MKQIVPPVPTVPGESVVCMCVRARIRAQVCSKAKTAVVGAWSSLLPTICAASLTFAKHSRGVFLPGIASVLCRSFVGCGLPSLCWVLLPSVDAGGCMQRASAEVVCVAGSGVRVVGSGVRVAGCRDAQFGLSIRWQRDAGSGGARCREPFAGLRNSGRWAGAIQGAYWRGSAQCWDAIGSGLDATDPIGSSLDARVHLKQGSNRV